MVDSTGSSMTVGRWDSRRYRYCSARASQVHAHDGANDRQSRIVVTPQATLSVVSIRSEQHGAKGYQLVRPSLCKLGPARNA